ncbi:MAG TPA: gliding motility-associated ABC transporter substrate-binding protein GldG [Aquaticitalea sp.]|nr:gliding motility-associated ABC transporter substrate-binding protein GldG [Aquaticitalea sp.]HNU58699.1 gliding motility-associated ABC transporter substrate-binding protein GldG [Aquaticitalea sp.]
MMLKNKQTLKKTVLLLTLLVLVNILGSHFYKRFDLTQDKRYTLSESALGIVENIDSPLIVDVFLEGDFPSEYRRLRDETRQLLEEFALHNPQIKFSFIDPIEDEKTRDANISQLVNRGLEPRQLTVSGSGKTSKALIFPWALASYQEQTVKIPLIKNIIGATTDETISSSVQNLEYAFAEGFKKLVVPKEKKIAILKGNGELSDIYIADFLKTIKEHYFIAPFTLDSVSSNPVRTLDRLKDYDLVIAAKPTETFTENEKYVLDQYTMNGGKSLWLTESVVMDTDSLKNEKGSAVAVMRDLNLTDFFFKYGLRINPNIVNDLYSAPIWLALGEGSEAQFQPLRWPYSPLAGTNPEHPITSNLNMVKFDFASQIDTLKNGISKKILLKSSDLTKLEGVPSQISLDIVTQEPDLETYTKGPQPLAVLLEGTFTSVYNNRIKPFQIENDKQVSTPTKMIVVSDGDVIRNDVVQNQPQELGFDRWTGRSFGNKEFLENAVNYLLNDDGLINIRSKEIVIPYMDRQKTTDQRTLWQSVNIALPLAILGLFGLGYGYIRKRKYT